jgi:gamma-glutamyl hydrolase
MPAARYSSHKPESPEQELAMLIYSTPPVFSARFETMDEDNYDGPYQVTCLLIFLLFISVII